ncbi:MAG TPA: right-handed parallel beta-helix repeat-containing protein [Pirellulales bacterium]|nr:right-handed parallel beta-helix repeat-containing protein [Pirellulales bacterium]
MRAYCLALSLTLSTNLAAADDLVIEQDNLVVTRSGAVRPGTYQVADPDDNGVLHLRGDDLVVDFRQAELAGAQDGDLPDQFQGRGIVIEDSSRVVLRNAKVRGFKIGIYVRNCRDVTIENCDLSDNFKQHLLSTPQAENGADWLFGHENDNNEWLRYGAAIYLDGCTEFTVRNNVARRGQNGVCLVRSHDGAVYDNDCSFNSGWGLALYRADRNRISHNKLDWCIRGYSHGVYNRGQDSAGILIFEQCSDNIFAFNSATHGGDGFFLFAGLDTIDETGEGGSNGNLVYRNDFSHASNNGIEATFSRGNRFVENILDEADHAIWAGYSYDSQFVGNKISHCHHGISIEHGSNNRIEANRFENNGVAVNLWANDKPGFVEKPYGKLHHCRSESYQISRNLFDGNRLDVRLVNTGKTAVSQNDFRAGEAALNVDGRCREVTVERNNISGTVRVGNEQSVSFAGNYFSGKAPAGATSADAPLPLDHSVPEADRAPPEVPGRQDAFLPAGSLRGLKYVFVDEWGPYDFSKVKVFPEKPVFWGSGELRVLGPDTQFRVVDVGGGIDVAPQSGTLPAVLKLTAPGKQMRKWSFTIDLPERKQSLPVSGLILFAEWDVKFYPWTHVGPQMPPADWNEVLSGPVLEQRKMPRIDFSWGTDAPSAQVPRDHFATVATADIELPAGDYELRTVSDDGIRLKIDGRTVIDNWTWHPPTENTAQVKLEAGKHAFRIEHFEIDGVAQLQFSLTPVGR